jgi:hypothetical protein
MEIEEKELDEEKYGRRAIFTKKWCNDLHDVNCRPIAHEWDKAMSFLTQISRIEVDHTLKANQASECK